MTTHPLPSKKTDILSFAQLYKVSRPPALPGINGPMRGVLPVDLPFGPLGLLEADILPTVLPYGNMNSPSFLSSSWIYEIGLKHSENLT